MSDYFVATQKNVFHSMRASVFGMPWWHTRWENRKPVEILRIEYNYLSLDSEGRIDAGEQEKEHRLAVDLFPPVFPEEQSGQVIDAKHRFAKKRYKDKYRWTPSPELEAAIVKAIFGKNRFF